MEAIISLSYTKIFNEINYVRGIFECVRVMYEFEEVHVIFKK